MKKVLFALPDQISKELMRILGDLKKSFHSGGGNDLALAGQEFSSFVTAYAVFFRKSDSLTHLVDTWNQALSHLKDIQSKGRLTLSSDECDYIVTPLLNAIDRALDELNKMSDLDRKATITNTFHISGGVNGLQAGNGSATLNMSIADLITEIDKSNGSDKEKAEAKNLLQRFIEHPLVNTLIGVALTRQW